MLVDHDVVADIEAESRSLAGFFRGEKRVENPVLDVFWNSGSVVFDLDNHLFIRVVDPYRKTASSIHGIDGVVDDVGPCPVQIAAEGLDCRYAFVVFPVDLDALLQLAPEHEQGAVESFSDIDRLDGRLIEERVGLQRTDDIGNLAGRLPDLFKEAADTCRPADEYGYRRRGLGAERFFELVEFLAYKPGVNQIGSDLPGVFDVAFFEPALQFVFDIAAVERVDFVGSPRGTGNFAEQCVQCVFLLRCERESCECALGIAIRSDRFGKLGCTSFDRRGGVVQLVGHTCRERSQLRHPFALSQQPLG